MNKCRYCDTLIFIPAWKTCETPTCVKAVQRKRNIKAIASMKRTRARWRMERDKVINRVLLAKKTKVQDN